MSTKFRRAWPIVATIILLACAAFPILAQSTIEPGIDEIMRKAFPPQEPGAAIVVVKDGRTIHRRGYGMANMELGVAIEPDMVFRIGSVTKQFTAVAILMLMEEGKLSLQDEITKFFPDYPTQGQKITVEHLLTHTSGIKSYTGLPEWRPLWRKDVSMKEMIDLFKDKPMEFAPGAKWNYNNSGFVLLGAIIEKVSGQSYSEFVQKRIFAPLGMNHSFYDQTSRLIPRRVPGYSKAGPNYVNSAYLSMNWPHAAGALASTVDDLAIWDAALYTEKILKQETLRKAWTSYRLADGREAKYGFGWFVATLDGSRTIEHGGGINGFTCYTIRLPEEKVFVAILTNRDSGTANLPLQIAALAAGKTYREPTSIALTTEQLDRYAGFYALSEKEEFLITRDGDKLSLTRPNSGKQQLEAITPAEFFLKNSPTTRVIFTQDNAGKVSGMTVKNRLGPDEPTRRLDKPLPQPKEAAPVDPAVFEAYVGEYDLAPGMIMTISKEGNKLMVQVTGQPRIELRPESPTRYSVAEVGATIEFVAENGTVTSLVLTQLGQKMTAKKIK